MVSPGPANRLAAETSPYLLLHAHNPVDWYPWGEEAIARARAEEKPIFLSVGYSTCYWCHVMERESFSDPKTAELMNREFINVKLDREERPELDEIYMTATQLLTGQGGWPNSVFLTPDLEPFYAGTYFPPDDRYGRPGFGAVLRALATAWRERRSEVVTQAQQLGQALKRYLEERADPASAPPPPQAAERSLLGLEQRFDREWGGFGDAPKFPTPSNLLLLQELEGERAQAGEMLTVTLDRMARGGIYDQVGGGFHRYATDRLWRVPHFEKMLYDNAFLLEVYARRSASAGDPEAARVAAETAAFLARELTSPEGALWSAIDAETEGREGAYYVWTEAELRAVLGEEEFTFLAPILGFSEPPFFEGESYVLHLPYPLAEQAERRHLRYGKLVAELAPLREQLRAARERRPRPLTDDKVLADWNGMAIAGLAVAGRLLGDAGLVERAERAADFLLGELRPGKGPLRHVWRAGRARVPAFLSDYAYVVRGLLELHEATGRPRRLEEAVLLAEEMEARLADPRGGHFGAAESPDVLLRSRDLFDGAVPSPSAIAILDLIELARRTGDERWRRRAEAALRAATPLVEVQAEAARTMTVAARRFAALPDLSRGGGAVPPDALPECEDLRAEAAGKVTPRLALGSADAEGWRPFRLELVVAEGWHVNAAEAGAFEPDASALVPTTLRGLHLDLRDLVQPPRTHLPRPEGAPSPGVYEGTVSIEGRLRPQPGGSPRLLVTFQPCDETRCLPAASLEIPLGGSS